MSRKTFTWRLSGPLPAGLNREQVEMTLRMALTAWERVCGVAFVKDYGIAEKVDITFAFGRPTRSYHTAERTVHGGQNFIIFNDAETWCPIQKGFWGWIKRITQSGKDLLTFSMHEVGHCLGLMHVSPFDDNKSVMHDSPEASGYVNGPSENDGIEARRIWP